MGLFPGQTFEALQAEFLALMQSEKFKIFLYRLDETPIAFIYLSIRTDYVEGSNGSPTGYVEGVYVQPNYRRQGISRKLFVKGMEWLKEQGCKQVGSDIEMDNDVSYAFHRGIGFKETGRLITFIRDI